MCWDNDDCKIEHESTEEIVCPYCGYEFSNSFEYNDASGASIECLECDKEFGLEVQVTVEYTTGHHSVEGKG